MVAPPGGSPLIPPNPHATPAPASQAAAQATASAKEAQHAAKTAKETLETIVAAAGEATEELSTAVTAAQHAVLAQQRAQEAEGNAATALVNAEAAARSHGLLYKLAHAPLVVGLVLFVVVLFKQLGEAGAQPDAAGILAVGLVLTVVGLILRFPGILQNGTGSAPGAPAYSAVRLALIIVATTFSALALKAGWKSPENLAKLAIDRSWIWVLAVVFGSTAFQTFAEPRD